MVGKSVEDRLVEYLKEIEGFSPLDRKDGAPVALAWLPVIIGSFKMLATGEQAEQISLMGKMPMFFDEIERMRKGIEEIRLDKDTSARKAKAAGMQLLQIDGFLRDAADYFKQKAEKLLPGNNPHIDYFTRRVFVSACRSEERDICSFSSAGAVLRDLANALAPRAADPFLSFAAAAALTKRIETPEKNFFGETYKKPPEMARASLRRLRTQGHELGLF